TRNGPERETRVRRPTTRWSCSASAGRATRTIAARVPMSSPLAAPIERIEQPRSDCAGVLATEQEPRDGLSADVARGARLDRMARARHDHELPLRCPCQLLPGPGERSR